MYCALSYFKPYTYDKHHVFVCICCNLFLTSTICQQSGLLPNGLHHQEGLSLELRKVRRQDGGTYVCVATNGVGRPAEAHIDVNIKCKYVDRIFCDMTCFSYSPLRIS